MIVRHRRRLILAASVVGVLVLSAGGTLTVTGTDSGGRTSAAGAAPSATTPIKHVVILMKENRSFDEYFGKFPGADGATTGTLSNGTVVTLGHTPDPMPNDINHNAQSWQKAYDRGKMDGFNLETGAYSSTGTDLAYSQMSQKSIPNYWAYASRFALGDHFFSDWKGPSFGNNLFSVAAQAGQYDANTGNRTPYFIPTSNLMPRLSPWGCDSPPDSMVNMMSTTSGGLGEAFPCFDFKAMPDLLQQNGLSWSYYGAPGDQGYAHNALDALSQVRNVPSMWSNIKPIAGFTKAAAAGTLPAVTWIASSQNEHPPYSACAGENETVNFLNALMNGPDWSSTAVFVYWDEWGGFYDHVAPPQINSVSYGFRTPLIVISPWTRTGTSSQGGYISHTLYSQSAVLKFIESNWSLPSLTPSDAAANDMMDLFDFSGSPPKAKLILTPRTCTPLTGAERQLARTRSTD